MSWDVAKALTNAKTMANRTPKNIERNFSLFEPHIKV